MKIPDKIFFLFSKGKNASKVSQVFHENYSSTNFSLSATTMKNFPFIHVHVNV